MILLPITGMPIDALAFFDKAPKIQVKLKINKTLQNLNVKNIKWNELVEEDIAWV